MELVKTTTEYYSDFQCFLLSSGQKIGKTDRNSSYS